MDDNCPFTTAALESLLDALLRFELRQAEQGLADGLELKSECELTKEYHDQPVVG